MKTLRWLLTIRIALARLNSKKCYQRSQNGNIRVGVNSDLHFYFKGPFHLPKLQPGRNNVYEAVTGFNLSANQMVKSGKCPEIE